MPNTETPASADPSFEQDFDAFLTDTESTWQGDDEFEGVEAEPDPVTPDTQAAADDSDEPAVTEKNDPAVTRGLDRLVAKEIEVQRREESLRAREETVSRLEQEVESLRKKNFGVDDLTQMINLDPGEALTRLGVNPDHVINLYLAKRMGDKAPPELRQALQKAQEDKRFRELENKLAARDREAQYADHQRRTSEEVRAYVSGDLNGIAPTVAARLKSKPERFEAALLEEIRLDAVERLTRGEAANGLVISAQEAARRLEKRLTDWLDGTPSTNPAAGKAAVTNATQGKNAGQGEAAKPPVKNRRPLRPWQSQEDTDLEDAGIRAAVGEFRRSESARRR